MESCWQDNEMLQQVNTWNAAKTKKKDRNREEERNKQKILNLDQM